MPERWGGMNLRSPLARVRGLGSAKEGVHHWWAQRVTAIALIPLCLWFILSLAGMGGADYNAIIQWMQSPVICAALILLVIALFYHAQLGVQVVIEDYVGCKALRIGSIILTGFVFLFSGLASITAVLKIFLEL